MSNVTIAQVNDAIASTLAPAVQAPNVLGKMQSYGGLGDSITETPTIQVCFAHGDGHLSNTEVNRGTFGSASQPPLRQRGWVFWVDVVATERNVMAQDMSKVIALVSLIEDLLDAQQHAPFFGVVGIHTFDWHWDRVTYEESGRKYAGFRAVITTWIY